MQVEKIYFDAKRSLPTPSPNSEKVLVTKKIAKVIDMELFSPKNNSQRNAKQFACQSVFESLNLFFLFVKQNLLTLVLDPYLKKA